MKYVVDTSAWIDMLQHARTPSLLHSLMLKDAVLIHPDAFGEICMGRIDKRDQFLESLDLLPVVERAPDRLIRTIITQKKLYGTQGLTFIDIGIVVAASLHGHGLLTLDAKQAAAGRTLGVACPDKHP